MKIIKVPITEKNKKLFWSKNETKLNKKKWDLLLNQSFSMTAKEFWINEWENYFKSQGNDFWFFVVGEPESIIDELINLKIGDSYVSYPWVYEHSPEDLIESRTDWDMLKKHADNMYYFIDNLYNYIDKTE